MHGAEFTRRQTGGFLEEKIAEYETVGMEMLRCTAGAGEITTPARIRQAEVVAHGPTD